MRFFKPSQVMLGKFIPIFGIMEPTLDSFWKEYFYQKYTPILTALQSDITNPVLRLEFQENIAAFQTIFNKYDPNLKELFPAIRSTRQFLRTYCHGNIAWKKKGDELLRITDILMPDVSYRPSI